MTQAVQTVLDSMQVRKTKKQKAAFIAHIQALAEKEGYICKVEKGAFGIRNIVVGDVGHAKAVFGAHYDTCAVLPFPNFIAPKAIGLYILYQLAIVLGFFLIAFAIGFGAGFACVAMGIDAAIGGGIAKVVYLGLLCLLLFGPANKHTANDNTSGVAVLMELMERLPQEQRENACFVFFDLEEAGTLGSSSFYSKHKKEMKEKLLVNFDCVSDGEDMLIVPRKKARSYTGVLEAAFAGDALVHTQVLQKGIFYPSDQANFPKGVCVAAFQKTKKGLLYLSRIHTPKDTVFREENIDFLAGSCIKLIEKL